MRNAPSLALAFLFVLSSFPLIAQESSSAATRATQPVQAPQSNPPLRLKPTSGAPFLKLKTPWPKARNCFSKSMIPVPALMNSSAPPSSIPGMGGPICLLGLAQMQLQQWSDAQWAFEEATKVEPGNAKAYLGAGSALNEAEELSWKRRKRCSTAWKFVLTQPKRTMNWPAACGEWESGNWRSRTCARPSNSTRTMPGRMR